ncbi:MAG: cytochrome c [Meiothermus sp.]|nr:cytochrome c [Meiothermus sp.]
MLKRLVMSLLVVGVSSAVAQGATVYQQCQGCHQATGAGINAVFPPLAGHVPEILAAKGGRQWIIRLLLNGMTGQISVKGVNYNGAMPGYKQLSDQQIADVLNHISTQWGNKFPAGQGPFTAAEVKAQRATALTGAQVNQARAALGLK